MNQPRLTGSPPPNARTSQINHGEPSNLCSCQTVPPDSWFHTPQNDRSSAKAKVLTWLGRLYPTRWYGFKLDGFWMVFGWCWDIRVFFFVSSFDPFQKQLAAPNEVHLAHDLLRRYDVHCTILDWRGHRLSATPLQELQEWGTNWWSIKPPSAEELQSHPTASMFHCTMIFELDHVKFSGGESMGWVNLRC